MTSRFNDLKLMTVRELSEYLDVTPAAIYKWIKEGSMPTPIRLGGPRSTLRWRKSVIEEWLEENSSDRE